MEQLKQLLRQIHGKGYKAYKNIKGQYQFPGFTLNIDHVQGDPFAAPSRISITVPMRHAGFSEELWESTDSNPIRRIALEDFLARALKHTIHKTIKGCRGSGCSGIITIETSGQQILIRNAMIVTAQSIEARIVMGLPADGRRVAGIQAQQMFYDELPIIIEKALYAKNLSVADIQTHLNTAEDQDALRHQLKQHKLVAFIANGANLPRSSGIDDTPLATGAITFQSPPSLQQTIQLPHAGTITGMGIPEGITLIVGGGFHGKSTLLHALEHGPYNHIPGDGREQVASRDSAVKVRAEDGRAISNVNISPFIDRLPFGRNTQQFSTENASGSTSQAANIIEALECGAELLLIDEDTSATNFMIRDERMQALVSHDKEPITPLVFRIRELYEKHGVSTVIVMGGSGDYFDIADTTIMMDAYQPKDVTQEARSLVRGLSAQLSGQLNNLPPFQRTTTRKPGMESLNPSRKNRDVSIDAKDLNTLFYGTHRIDLSQVEQLIDIGQTRCIGLMIHYYANHYADSAPSLAEGLKQLMLQAQCKNLDIFSPYKVGNLAMPRKYEIAAAINRIRNSDWNSEYSATP
ncbi:MAG: ABC-ATPase domain-containing protein [Gammaproteobacteria bacterium]|nr:ABC-ATPase domain-containing protein [Gammaproteobacteria bacterium]